MPFYSKIDNGYCLHPFISFKHSISTNSTTSFTKKCDVLNKIDLAHNINDNGYYLHPFISSKHIISTNSATSFTKKHDVLDKIDIAHSINDKKGETSIWMTKKSVESILSLEIAKPFY